MKNLLISSCFLCFIKTPSKLHLIKNKHINSLIREESDNKEEHEPNKKESIIKTEIEESI